MFGVGIMQFFTRGRYIGSWTPVMHCFYWDLLIIPLITGRNTALGKALLPLLEEYGYSCIIPIIRCFC